MIYDKHKEFFLAKDFYFHTLKLWPGSLQKAIFKYLNKSIIDI